jgi:hypothetical protein
MPILGISDCNCSAIPFLDESQKVILANKEIMLLAISLYFVPTQGYFWSSNQIEERIQNRKPSVTCKFLAEYMTHSEQNLDDPGTSVIT